jgi:hypothetical protein
MNRLRYPSSWATLVEPNFNVGDSHALKVLDSKGRKLLTEICSEARSWE